MKQAQGITEQLKAENILEWAGQIQTFPITPNECSVLRIKSLDFFFSLSPVIIKMKVKQYGIRTPAGEKRILLCRAKLLR